MVHGDGDAELGQSNVPRLTRPPVLESRAPSVPARLVADA